ncbi:MAG: DUF5652 family protein [bacterium]|nr:DUF5652 family protein [bacterium]
MPQLIFEPGFFAPFVFFLPFFIVWSIFWKGWALWKSARREDKKWFIALLVINTGGILEILYIYIFSEKSDKKEGESEGSRKDSPSENA